MNVRAIIERETPAGTEVLLQVRDRAGEPRTLELPGGRLEEFEPILAGLAREVAEETGLRVVELLDGGDRRVHVGGGAEVECLTPCFVYQTLRGPVDSVGFYFRCRAEGALIDRGDDAFGHRWVGLTALAGWFARSPDEFDWLTQAGLAFYLNRPTPSPPRRS